LSLLAWFQRALCSVVRVIQPAEEQNPSTKRVWSFTLQNFLRNKNCERHLRSGATKSGAEGGTNTLLFASLLCIELVQLGEVRFAPILIYNQSIYVGFYM